MKRQTLHDELLKWLKEKRRFLQVLAGPRQVGKLDDAKLSPGFPRARLWREISYWGAASLAGKVF